MKWTLKDKKGFQEAQKELVAPVVTPDVEDLIKLAFVNDRTVVGVGDYTCFKKGYYLSHRIFDGLTECKPFDMTIHTTIDAWLDNPAGCISEDVLFEIINSLRYDCKTYALKINGEEDLIALAYILLADNGSFVLWGDPFEKCTRYVIVDAEIKMEILAMMLKYGEFEYE